LIRGASAKIGVDDVRIVADGKTDRGRKRRRNEDRILVSPAPSDGGPLLLAVADGMGGLAAGDTASARAIDALESVVREHAGRAPAELLTLAVHEANRAVRQLSSSITAKGAGTTLVAALIDGSRVWLANVGDSRAYIVRGADCEQVTVDHSWAEEEVRAGVISREDAASSKHRNVLTRNIGAGAAVAADLFGPIELRDRDALVLCSDGLHSVVAGEDIASVVRGSSPGDAAKHLVDMANAAGGPDNISVIVAVAASEG
jgi:protein phosphatase